MLPIKSAEDFHHHDPRWGNHTTATERIVLKNWHMETDGFYVTLPKMVSNKAFAYARVCHGVWLVDCPWCGSAQRASREDHRFFCVECENNTVNNVWISVVWPPEWQEIERLLGVRPIPANMNWFPGEGPTANIHGRETLEDLQVENIKHMGVK
jgi:hypothetical protein